MIRIRRFIHSFFLIGLVIISGCASKTDSVPTTPSSDQWVIYDGYDGPGSGKHIVFVTGDEEYRSEEAMPQMAKILAKHHGFKSTVLFAIDPKTGAIDPETLDNIPGLDALASADLMVLFTRFRELPDDQMKHIVDYTNSGKPIIGLRTATHAFNYKKNPKGPYSKYSFNDKGFEGGYGRQVLGETWVSHYGHHGKESSRGVVAEGKENHPIVRGCEDIWGPTDVYEVGELTGNSEPVIMGQVLTGMNPEDPAKSDKPLMPLAWIKNYKGDTGNTTKVFTTTMGAATDLESEGLRRLLVNATYWSLGMESQIPDRANVDLVGTFNPTPFGFGDQKIGIMPSSHKIQ
ncbi:MAG: ThuA domain-containing protein [Candidatus Neomarinimicrobiota bacterium]